jgi:hypothetical protein
MLSFFDQRILKVFELVKITNEGETDGILGWPDLVDTIHFLEDYRGIEKIEVSAQLTGDILPDSTVTYLEIKLQDFKRFNKFSGSVSRRPAALFNFHYKFYFVSQLARDEFIKIFPELTENNTLSDLESIDLYRFKSRGNGSLTKNFPVFYNRIAY